MFELGLMILAASAAQASEAPASQLAIHREAERLQSRDPRRARALFQEAARRGYAPAQASLGILLFKDGNRAEALPWLKQAAAAGEPRALLIYGTAMFNGDGVPPNRVQGYAMVRRAAAQGSALASATQSEMELVMPELEREAGVKLATGVAPDAAEPPSSVQFAKAAAESRGRWRIQLGAFRQPGAGQALFARLAQRLPGKQPVYVAAGSLTRLQVGPYATSAQAAAACRALGAQQACMPVRVR